MMSETQNQGGGALESHPFGSGFGPPLSGKDPYSPPSNSNGLTDLSSDSHLTLLKGSSGLGPFASFGDAEARLSDSFMEMRYIQLGDWDLTGYTAEGLTARLIDNRSLNDSPDNIIQYRPWEKPGSSLGPPLGTITTTAASPPQLVITSNGNTIASTQGKSPTTLTTLTNAFPTFSDAFGPNGQKLPSFQSQFNSFNDPPLHQHTPQPPHQHNPNNGHNGDMQASPVPTTTSPGASSLPSFHTLPPNRGYVHPGGHQTLITAPLQARDLQHQFLDERHIQIFPGQLITTTAPVPVGAQHQGVLTNGNGHHYVTTTNPMLMNGHQAHGNGFISGNGGSPSQHFLELVPVSPMQLHGHYAPHPHPKPTDGTTPSLNLSDLHHTHHNGNLGLPTLNGPPTPAKYHSPGDGQMDGGHHHHLHHQITRLDQSHPQNSPQIVTNSNGGLRGAKKTPKRKRNSIEPLDPAGYNNNGTHPNPYVNGGNGNHDLNSEPQVSSVSSTDSDFKRPNLGPGMEHGTHLHHNGGMEQGGMEKASKKKRKRCGECTGCSRKDNCADCAPCRNEKSHQICKQRRCEKLTEKKSRAGRVAAGAVMK